MKQFPRILAVIAVVAWLGRSASTLRDPPSGAHAWRETDGLIIARNYCEENAPFAEPRVNNRGTTDGRTGVEFPLLNFLSGKLGCSSHDFVTPWRVLSLLCSLMALLSLVAFARKRWGNSAASWVAVVFATSPLVPYFSRATQPDPAAMGFGALSMWLASGTLFWAAPLMVGVAGLIKLPALVYLLPVVMIAAWNRPWRQRFLLVGPIFFALLAVWLWYRHAAQLQTINGIHNFGLSRTFPQLWAEWNQSVFWVTNFTQHPFDVWLFPLFSGLAVGAAILFSRSSLKSPLAWALGFSVISYLMLSGYGAAHHEYYGVIILPFLSLGLGRVFSQVEPQATSRWPRAATWAAMALLVSALGWQHFRARNWWARNVEAWTTFEKFCLKELSPPGREKIRVFSDASPQMFWFSHQFGEFGDSRAPTISSGEVALVDRIRLWRNIDSVEQTLRAQGCLPFFENEVALLCRAPK